MKTLYHTKVNFTMPPYRREVTAPTIDIISDPINAGTSPDT